MPNKEKILKVVFDFFVKSSDFNGISLSRLAKKVELEYKDVLFEVVQLVTEDSVSVQDGDNPHIIRFAHYDKETQLKYLKEAENNETKVLDTIKPKGFKTKVPTIVVTMDTHALCVYPSPSYLKKHLRKGKFNFSPFSKRLSLGEAQLTPLFFEVDVLERYFSDPRYRFQFEDYSGSISYKETEDKPSELQEHDKVFLKTFGLGYDESKSRVVVAYLRYLAGLSKEHQIYWNSKIITPPCKMAREYYENTILGNWTFSQSIFSAVIEEHRIINELMILITGKNLFRETFEGNKRPKEFTFFTTPTLLNFETFISLLDKMLSENINKDFFKGTIEDVEIVEHSDGTFERKTKGTLRLLDEWMRKFYRLRDESGYKRLLAPFHQVRKERQNPAHKISENQYDKIYFEKQEDLLDNVYTSLLNLRSIFHEHPKARHYELPKWIKNGEIKKF